MRGGHGLFIFERSATPVSKVIEKRTYRKVEGSNEDEMLSTPTIHGSSTNDTASKEHFFRNWTL